MTQVEKYDYVKQVQKGLKRKNAKKSATESVTTESDVQVLEYDGFGRQVHTITTSQRNDRNKVWTQTDARVKSFDSAGRALDVERYTQSKATVEKGGHGLAKSLSKAFQSFPLLNLVFLVCPPLAAYVASGSLGGQVIHSTSHTVTQNQYKADGTLDEEATKAHTTTLAEESYQQGKNYGDKLMQAQDIVMAVGAVVLGVVLAIIPGTQALAAACIAAATALYATARRGISTHDLGMFGENHDRAEAKQNAMGFYSSVASVAVAGAGAWMNSTAVGGTWTTMAVVAKTGEQIKVLSDVARYTLLSIQVGGQMAAASAGGANGKTLWTVGALAVTTGLLNRGVGFSDTGEIPTYTQGALTIAGSLVSTLGLTYGDQKQGTTWLTLGSFLTGAGSGGQGAASSALKTYGVQMYSKSNDGSGGLDENRLNRGLINQAVAEFAGGVMALGEKKFREVQEIRAVQKLRAQGINITLQEYRQAMASLPAPKMTVRAFMRGLLDGLASPVRAIAGLGMGLNDISGTGENRGIRSLPPSLSLFPSLGSLFPFDLSETFGSPFLTGNPQSVLERSLHPVLVGEGENDPKISILSPGVRRLGDAPISNLTRQKGEKLVPGAQTVKEKKRQSLYDSLEPLFRKSPGVLPLPMGLHPLKVQGYLVGALYASASDALGMWDGEVVSPSDRVAKDIGVVQLEEPNSGLIQSIASAVGGLGGAIKSFIASVYEKVADFVSGRSAQGYTLKHGELYSRAGVKAVSLQTANGEEIEVIPGKDGIIGRLEHGKIVLSEGLTVRGVTVLSGIITLRGGVGKVESMRLPLEKVGAMEVPGGVYRLSGDGNGWLDLPGKSMGLNGGVVTLSAQSVNTHSIGMRMAYVGGSGTWTTEEGLEYSFVRALSVGGVSAAVLLERGGDLFVANGEKIESATSIAGRIRENANGALSDVGAVKALEARTATAFERIGVVNSNENATRAMKASQLEAERNLANAESWVDLAEGGQWEMASLLESVRMDFGGWTSRVERLERGVERLAKAETFLKQVEGALTESGKIRMELQVVASKGVGLFRVGIRDIVKSGFSEPHAVLSSKAEWAKSVVERGVDFALAEREARNAIAAPSDQKLGLRLMKWPGFVMEKMLAKGVDLTEDLDTLTANGDMDAKLTQAFNVFRIAKWGYDKTAELYDRPTWVRVLSVGPGLVGRGVLEVLNWIVPVVRLGAVTAVVVEHHTTNMAENFGMEKEEAQKWGSWVGLGSGILLFAGAASATTKAGAFVNPSVRGAVGESARSFTLGSGKEFAQALGITTGIVVAVEGGVELGGKALGWTRLQIDDGKEVGFMIAGNFVARVLQRQASRLKGQAEEKLKLAINEEMSARGQRNEMRLNLEKRIESVMSAGGKIPKGKTEYNGRLYTKLETKTPAGMLEHNGSLYKAIGDGKQPTNPRLLENLLSKGGLNANAGRNSQLAQVEDLGVLLQRARAGGAGFERAGTEVRDTGTEVRDTGTELRRRNERVQRYRNEAGAAYAEALRLERMAEAFDSADTPEGWDPLYSRLLLPAGASEHRGGIRATNLLKEAKLIVNAAWERGSERRGNVDISLAPERPGAKSFGAASAEDLGDSRTSRYRIVRPDGRDKDVVPHSRTVGAKAEEKPLPARAPSLEAMADGRRALEKPGTPPILDFGARDSHAPKDSSSGKGNPTGPSKGSVVVGGMVVAMATMLGDGNVQSGEGPVVVPPVPVQSTQIDISPLADEDHDVDSQLGFWTRTGARVKGSYTAVRSRVETIWNETKSLVVQTADRAKTTTHLWVTQTAQAFTVGKDAAINGANTAVNWTEDVTRSAASKVHETAISYRDDVRTIGSATVELVKNAKEYSVDKAQAGWTMAQERAGAIAKPYAKNVSVSFQEITRAHPVTANKLAIGIVASVFSGDAFDNQAAFQFDTKGPAVVTVNGVFTSEVGGRKMNRAINTSLGIQTSVAIVNNSHGPYVGDILQVAAHEFLGVIDTPAVQTATALRRGIQEKGEVYLIAHSQGTAISNVALELLTKEERSNVHYLGLGSETYVSANTMGLADAKNVRNEGDPVFIFGNNIRVSNWLVFSEWSRKIDIAWTRINQNADGNRHSFKEFYRQEVDVWAKERGLK
ncbi:MAG: hypothetical protein IPP35_03940 [Elusimicrobia bacterium]|nr:hypothetical protein [Elusimicrobiota bacterium]